MVLPGRNIAGGGKTLEERGSDFYPTPPYATERLLEMVVFSGSVLEPACGKGHMSRVLERKFEVESYDKENMGYGYVKNFFLETRKFDNVITNPPYRHALEFVEKAKRIATQKIAMFLKLTFLEGQSRYNFFQEKEFALQEVLVFSERITLSKGGLMDSGGTAAYAWFIWDYNYAGFPRIKWIKPKEKSANRQLKILEELK